MGIEYCKIPVSLKANVTWVEVKKMQKIKGAELIIMVIWCGFCYWYSAENYWQINWGFL